MAWISVLRPGEGEQQRERELERGSGGGDGGKADPWTGVGLSSSGMQTDREGGREAAEARPTQARNLPSPCERAGQTLPAHKAQAAARRNESQMSTGLVSGLPPPPSLGVAPAAKDWSCGWMRVGELAWPCHPPSSGRISQAHSSPTKSSPYPHPPPTPGMETCFILGQIRI